MHRRHFLQSAAATAATYALSGCAHPRVAPQPAAPALPLYDIPPSLAPIRAHEDRLFRITVCLRPFRAAGPRMDAEKLGSKLIIHNYGHGGSGWSLSWGSARFAVEKALAVETSADGLRHVGVIGCGALGLTAAITAQRAGCRVTIYAKERPPEVRSARATGSWTPDSRIALASKVDTNFAVKWEQMARTSWAMYQSFYGAPGNPVEFIDRYMLSDGNGQGRPRNSAPPSLPPGTPDFDFLHLMDRIDDITNHGIEIPSALSPFPTAHTWRASELIFNVADYSRQLVQDFELAGGRIETREFHTPADLASLPEPVLINCTGYGARQLWSDESITPFRGQIAWLIPQEECHYGLFYNGLSVLCRRDGIVLQNIGLGEMDGYNDTNETPDRNNAIAQVRILQELYTRMATMPRRS